MPAAVDFEEAQLLLLLPVPPEPTPTLLLLLLPLLLPLLPPFRLLLFATHSSKAKRGMGRDMGRSVNRAGRSLHRGSVGISSAFSSQRGVPGRLLQLLLLLLPSVRLVEVAVVVVVLLAVVSTSQGMMRGRLCFVLLVAPSPELSVESLDTLLLGRPRMAADEEEAPLLLDSLVGVDEGVAPLWRLSSDEKVDWMDDGWAEEASAEMGAG